MHEIDEATLYSNSHDVGRDIKRTLNDTHFGTEVMADELMNNNILFGNDYNSTMYDPVRKGRAQQYNGTIIDPKDPQKARKIYPPQTHSEIGNLLGVEKNENKRLYGLKREGLKPTKWATEAYDMVLPNISQKEFIARAKQIDSDLRAKIRNNQKVNSFSSRSSQAAENLLPNSSIKNVSNWVNNNRKLLATGGGLAALGGFIYLINRYRGNNENNG